MKAVILDKTGGADNLRYDDAPDPTPTGDRCIVRVHAAGVCFRDIIDRRGGFPGLKLPVILGHELAGEVVEVGPDVRNRKVGDRVVNLHRSACGSCRQCAAGRPMFCETSFEYFGATIDGAYAELVSAPEGTLVTLPDAIAWADAAPLCCTAGVALQAIRGRAQVQAGERVLVTGASGGVGHQAIQLLKHLRAEVIAVTSSQSKEQALRDLGADHVLVPQRLDAYHKELQYHLGAGGVDAVLEIVGSVTMNASMRVLRPGGRMIVIGNVEGGRVELNPGQLILFGRSVHGSAGCTSSDLNEVLGLVERGALKPPTTARLPLSDAAEAHRRLETKGVTGRIVLEPPAP